MKSIKPDMRPWTQRLSKSRPVLDEDGNPMREPKVLKEGFWKSGKNPVVELLSGRSHGAGKQTRRK